MIVKCEKTKHLKIVLSLRIFSFSGAKIYMTKMLNVLYRFKPFYKMTKICKLEKKHLFDGVFLIADEIYNEYQAKKKESDDDDGYKKSPRNFINTLIDPKNGLDRDEVRDEINTFVTAVSKQRK